MTRANVCVVGSINRDLVVHAPRLPMAGETILGGPFETHPGGKGANQAVSAARLGGAVSMVGAVGDDVHGASMIETLRDEGVDVTHVERVAGTATGVGVITVSDADGENSIVVAPGANHRVRPEHVQRARVLIEAADVLVLQLELPLETVTHAARLARAGGTMVLLNAAPAMMLDDALLGCVDVLVVNQVEAAMLVGDVSVDADAAIGMLTRRGPGCCIVTLGAAGAALGGASGVTRVPSPAVTPVDTVGAGDAFVGAVAASLSVEPSLETVVRFACAAGALAATRPGAIPSLPSRSAVCELLDSGA